MYVYLCSYIATVIIILLFSSVAMYMYLCYVLIITLNIPYKNKYWRGTKFGESADYHAIAKFKSR